MQSQSNILPLPTALVIKDGKVYEPVETELFTSYVPSTKFVVDKKEPVTVWKGPKIPWALWEQVVSFLRWTQKEFKAEAMMMFYYNRKSKEWAAWPFPQQPAGMTIKHLPDHPMFAEDRKKFGNDWVQLGTIHHHCTMKAFQSGTDKDDECDRDGVHITLGNMESKELDIHTRQVFSGMQSDGHIFNWVGTPNWMKDAPKRLRGKILAEAIITCDSEPAFPEEWKARIIRFIPPTRHWEQNSNGPGQLSLRTGGKNTSGATATGEERQGYLGFGEDHWKTRITARIRESLGAANLDPIEALHIMETDYSKMTPFERTKKDALWSAFLTNNVTPLLAEDIVRELVLDMKAKADDRTKVVV